MQLVLVATLVEEVAVVVHLGVWAHRVAHTTQIVSAVESVGCSVGGVGLDTGTPTLLRCGSGAPSSHRGTQCFRGEDDCKLWQKSGVPSCWSLYFWWERALSLAVHLDLFLLVKYRGQKSKVYGTDWVFDLSGTSIGKE